MNIGYAERITWSQLIASPIAITVYLVLVLPQLSRGIERVDWVAPMLWAIGVGIVVSIVLSIAWGIVAGMRDAGEQHVMDQRDREIERFGDRVGQAFLVLGGLAGLVLAMLDAASFWIGNALFAGFFVSAFVGTIARLVAYRRGFQ